MGADDYPNGPFVAVTVEPPFHGRIQLAVLAAAAGWLLGLRRSAVSALGGSGVLGVIVSLAGAPISR